MKLSLLLLAFASGLVVGSGPSPELAVAWLTLLGLAAIVAADYGRQPRTPALAYG